MYDGVCNLCDNFILFVIDRDINNTFKFSSLQDDFSKNLMKKSTKKFEQSIVLYSNGLFYEKSNAVIHILKDLGFPYNIMQVTLIIPKFLRDFIYDLIAKNRYKFFGKKESCRIPTPELSSKFIITNQSNDI